MLCERESLGSDNLPHLYVYECNTSGTCQSTSPPLPTNQEVYKAVWGPSEASVYGALTGDYFYGDEFLS